MKVILRRAARVGLGGVVVAAAVLAGGSAYFAHRPFEIPAELRAPDVLDPARPAGLRLRYGGVAGYEVTDGETTILLDPVLARPTIFELATGPVEIDEALGAKVYPRADFILVNHAHHDHGADAPAIALRTGAKLVGSRSMINLALSRGVPEAQTIVVKGGERLELGSFEVRVALGDHAPLLGMTWFMRGVIPADAGPLWFFEYRQDAAFAFHLASVKGNLLFHPQSGYIGDQLPEAEVVIFGAAGYPFSSEKLDALRDRTKARFVLPTHYDNFFQPRERGLAWLPVVDYEDLSAVFDGVEDPAWYLLDYDRWITLPGPAVDVVAPEAEPE